MAKRSSIKTLLHKLKQKILSFTYPERQNRALENLNLTIQKGKKVAILGKTGSGKSTLLQLLVRNYDANQGELFLAGKPIADFNTSIIFFIRNIDRTCRIADFDEVYR